MLAPASVVCGDSGDFLIGLENVDRNGHICAAKVMFEWGGRCSGEFRGALGLGKVGLGLLRQPPLRRHACYGQNKPEILILYEPNAI